jgi:hypothetical protein
LRAPSTSCLDSRRFATRGGKTPETLGVAGQTSNSRQATSGKPSNCRASFTVAGRRSDYAHSATARFAPPRCGNSARGDEVGFITLVPRRASNAARQSLAATHRSVVVGIGGHVAFHSCRARVHIVRRADYGSASFVVRYPACLASCGFPRNRRCEIPKVRPTQRGRRKVP